VRLDSQFQILDLDSYPLSGQGVKSDPQEVPRQVLGPYGRAYEPTGHLRDNEHKRTHEPRPGRETVHMYRGTSLTKKRTPLGPYRRPMPRVLGGS